MSQFEHPQKVEQCAPRPQEKRSLLVYGAGWNQIPILAASRRRGFRVIAVDRDAAAPGIGLADHFHLMSLRDHDRIEAALEGESIAGVLARITDAEGLASAQRLARSRGLPTACDRLVEAAISKRALARLARSAGIATPARLERGAKIDFARASVVVRPDVTVRGKAAVRQVSDPFAFARAWDEAASFSASGRVDAAHFVEGEDVSVLVAFEGGRANRWVVWDEWVAVDETGAMRGVGCGLPSRAAPALEAVDRVLGRIARAVPESRCLAIVSLRIDASGQPWLIEVHLGLGGDAIADRLLPAALPGWDAFAAWVEALSGGEMLPPRDAPRPCAVVRSEAGNAWSLLEARSAHELRDLVRMRVPSHWRLPVGLRSSESTP